MLNHRTRRRALALAAAVAACVLAVPASGAGSAPPHGGHKIVGYYVSWAAYARGYTPRAIEAGKLTHINYAFAAIVAGELGMGDSNVDPSNFAELQRLKDGQPRLKLLISVGGWAGSGAFSDVALTAASRQRFAASVVEFLRQHRFDGADIDWEYPVGGGRDGNIVRPEDKQNFTLLLQALRTALDAAAAADGKPYLLTIASGPSAAHVAQVELGEVARVVDWINVMTYDLNGAWNPVSGHNAPLLVDPDDPASGSGALSVATAIANHLQAGVPAAQIVVGLPSYGRTWAGCAAAHHREYQPCAGAAPGTWEPGVLDFTDIEENYLPRPDFERRFNGAARVPFLTNAATGQFISYDDVSSVSEKLAFVKANRLGGAMLWELSGDRRGVLTGAMAEHLLSAER